MLYTHYAVDYFCCCCNYPLSESVPPSCGLTLTLQRLMCFSTKSPQLKTACYLRTGCYYSHFADSVNHVNKKIVQMLEKQKRMYTARSPKVTLNLLKTYNCLKIISSRLGNIFLFSHIQFFLSLIFYPGYKSSLTQFKLSLQSTYVVKKKKEKKSYFFEWFCVQTVGLKLNTDELYI